MSSSTASELAELPGLESAKRVVLGLISGSAVQAVLFYGMRGSGKNRLAQILAKAWLCRQPTKEGACGECQACLAFDRKRSADYLEIEPVGASRIIRLGAISPTSPEDDDYPIPAQMFLRTPPLAARSRVVSISEAERLNPRAANSLLKTLEEPPPYARFILLTESVGAILPTVLSRCLAVACEVPAGLVGFEDWALSVAGGAPGRARELQDHAAIYRRIYEFAVSLPRRSPAEALLAAEQFTALADSLQAARKLAARAADAEALQVLAAAYRALPDARPAALQAMTETHRRILGNANAGSAFDALFATVVG
ncbi:MAG TPA: hypothetical protein VHE55_16975 [Fimbriimonadaceae bacterium]|nr:hypothetical protein [Fimbriimonadaceae bacterium]